MRKPDVTESSIRHMFERAFSSNQPIDELEQLKEEGCPLFDEEKDAICNSLAILDRTLVDLCRKNRITDEYFDAKWKRYAIRTLNMSHLKASNNKSNLLKSLKAGKITMKRYVEVVCNVLGFKFQSATFNFESNTGEQQSFAIQDPDTDANTTEQSNKESYYVN